MWILRYVPTSSPSLIDHGGRVKVPVTCPLEKRKDQGNPLPLGEGPHGRHGRTIDCLRQTEVVFLDIPGKPMGST